MLHRKTQLVFLLGVLIIGLPLTSLVTNMLPTVHAWRQPGTSLPAHISSNQSTSATLRFAATEYTMAVGDTITVSLIIEGADNTGGWQLLLSVDPTLVTLAELLPDGFLSSTGRITAPLGPQANGAQVAIGGYSYGTETGVSGTGVLAQLRFNALAAGQVDLNLDAPLLARVMGGAVDAQEAAAQSAVLIIVPAMLNVTIKIGTGNSVELTWQAPAQQAQFEVWKNSRPYFERGAPDASDISANCEYDGGVVRCVDAGGAGDPGQNAYYLISSFNNAGQLLAESRVAEFSFALTPGASLP